MIGRLALLLCAGHLVAGECVSVGELRYGSLEVVALDVTGQRLDSKLRLFTGEGRLEGEVTGRRFPRVPYGDYLLRVELPGFQSAKRPVRVSQAETIVRVELAVGRMDCAAEPKSISGRIRGRKSRGELWVKAVPVQGIGGFETRAGENGFFLISGLESSTYVVLVLDGDRILHSRTVKTYGDHSDVTRIVIDL